MGCLSVILFIPKLIFFAIELIIDEIVDLLINLMCLIVPTSKISKILY